MTKPQGFGRVRNSMKKSVEEMVMLLLQTTQEYTILYLKENKTMDRQMWAALHIGFVTCMKIFGYSEVEIEKVIDGVQEKIETLEKTK